MFATNADMKKPLVVQSQNIERAIMKINKIKNLKRIKQPARLSAGRRDIFIEKTEKTKRDDLHQEIRDLS